jgi:hypothetical protein
MDLEVDLSQLPPKLTLLEPRETGSFKVSIRAVERTRISPRALEGLAGEAERGDPEWAREFAAMLAYAEAHGWIRDGQVEAHVEWQEGEAA